MLKIGRAVFAYEMCDSTPALIDDFTLSGKELTLRGAIWEDPSVFGGTAAAKVSATAQRINGLIDSLDEPVVPVVWDDGPPDADGFYRVTRGSVSGATGLTPNGRMTFNLTLERVGGYAAPMFEAITLGQKRSTAQSAVTPQALFGLPLATRGFEVGANLTPNSFARTADGGHMSVFYDNANTLFNATPAFFIPASDWYTGASTLRVGTEVVVGQQVRNRPGDWSISNGLIRLTMAGTEINVERFDPFASPQWASIGYLQPGMQSGPAESIGDFGAPHTLTVMRNAPEEVRIRLTYDLRSISNQGHFAMTLDIGLRRGSRIADFAMRSRGTYTYRVQIRDFGEYRWLINGGSWHPEKRNVIAVQTGSVGPGNAEGEPASTRRVSGPPNNSDFAWGYGWSPTDNVGEEFEHPQAIVNQWAAAQSERVNAVVR